MAIAAPKGTVTKTAAAVKTKTAAAASAVKIAFPTPTTVQQWAVDLLEQAKTTVTGGKVQFLSGWATEEHVFLAGGGNVNAVGASNYNALSVEELPSAGFPTSGTSPIAFYPNLSTALNRTLTRFQMPDDKALYQAFTSKSPTMATLSEALADANWTGYGPGSSQEIAYEQTILGDANAINSGVVDSTINQAAKILHLGKGAVASSNPNTGGSGNSSSSQGGANSVGPNPPSISDITNIPGEILSGLTSFFTSSGAIRIYMIIIATVIGIIALKELTEDDHSPSQTVTTPVKGVKSSFGSTAEEATEA